MGIKGASIFCMHKPFDLSKGFAIDDLHVLFLGITSNLLNYWFGDSHKRKPYSINNNVKTCVLNIMIVKYTMDFMISLLSDQRV